MVAFTPLIAASILGLASAVPYGAQPNGIVHRITAGSTVENSGLHFEPQNVVAEIGDTIEFHFLPKAHTVVQSSFEKPCEPLAGGVFSGFNFNTTVGESDKVFKFVVQDKNPFWYYCSQTNGNHCQRGMSGVINQNFDGDKTLAKYKQNAVNTVTKQPSANPADFSGGYIEANKPL